MKKSARPLPLWEMRYPRMKGLPGAADSYHHVTTRTVNKEWLFRDVEKEMLRKHIWRVAEFCGVQVITHAEMSNHFHVVVRVPKQAPVDNRELLRRYAVLHSGLSVWEIKHMKAVERMLDENGPEAEQWRQRQLRQMNDISEYMKLLKQRFSIWFNRTHDRIGTLWAERFKSTLLQPGKAVLRMAAYVDLNGFRAGRCDDPKDYRFCGYAEAVAGDPRAQAGIMAAMQTDEWGKAQRAYRLIFSAVATHAKKNGQVIAPELLAKVAAEKGELSLCEVLAVKCRFLTDGAVLGSKAFVMEQLARYKEATGRGQRTWPRAFPETRAGLSVMRNLRLCGL